MKKIQFSCHETQRRKVSSRGNEYTSFDKDSDDDDDVDSDDDEDTDNEYQGFAFMQQDVVCSIQHEAAIPEGWILLLSHSTVVCLYYPVTRDFIAYVEENLIPNCHAQKTSSG